MSSGWVPLVVLDDPQHVLGNANRVLAAGKGHAKAQSLLVKVECECYLGQVERAWATLTESWHLIEDSLACAILTSVASGRSKAQVWPGTRAGQGAIARVGPVFACSYDAESSKKR